MSRQMALTETELNTYIETHRSSLIHYTPPWSREFWREQAEADRQHKTKIAAEAQAKTAAAAEVAQLRRRVAEIEQGLLAEDGWFVKAVGQTIGEIRRELEERIKTLENREPVPLPLPVLDQQGRPVLRYAGLWSSEKSYQAGDLATFNGSGWVALIDSRGLRPGDGMSWKLAVKGDPTHLKALVRDEVRKQLRERT
jgi:hypothetical protein